MIDACQPDAASLCFVGLETPEIRLPYPLQFGFTIEKMQDGSTDAPNGGYLQFTLTTGLAERVGAQRLSSLAGGMGIFHQQRHVTDRGTMHGVSGMGEALRFRVDQDIDAKLPPKRHFLVDMLRHLNKTQGLKQSFQYPGFLFVGGELDEFDTLYPYFRWHLRYVHLDAGVGTMHLIHEMKYRAVTIFGNGPGLPVMEQVIEDLQ